MCKMYNTSYQSFERTVSCKQNFSITQGRRPTKVGYKYNVMFQTRSQGKLKAIARKDLDDCPIQMQVVQKKINAKTNSLGKALRDSQVGELNIIENKREATSKLPPIHVSFQFLFFFITIPKMGHLYLEYFLT